LYPRSQRTPADSPWSLTAGSRRSPSPRSASPSPRWSGGRSTSSANSQECRPAWS